MRLLLISQYFWPENFRINDLVKGFREKGHDITILTGIPNYPAGRFFDGYGIFRKVVEDYHGARVLRVPLIPRGKGGSVSLVLNYLSFALSSTLFVPFLSLQKFDVIFVYQLSPVTVAIPALAFRKLSGIPLFCWVQDLWPESLSATGAVKSQRLLNLVGELVKFIYRRCDHILVSSKGFIPSVKRMGGRPDRINYFPNTAELLYASEQRKGDLPAGVSLPQGFIVMFAGNIGAAQDFGTILGAAERVRDYKDIHWVVLGDGRMADWVRKEAQDRKLSSSFHLLGRYPLEDMPNFFAMADVMLVTLKRELIFSLTVPGKVQSYLAFGKPIIAALDGEGGQIVEEAGAGLSCPAEDPKALADAVETMYAMMDSARKEMGERGIRYFHAHFERQMLIDRLEGWMKECGRGEDIA